MHFLRNWPLGIAFACMFYLTPQDKMVAIRQMIFWDAFSWMKWFVFWLKFHWKWFQRVQLTINQHCNRRQAIKWTNAEPIHWRTFAALGGDELTEEYSTFTTNITSRLQTTWRRSLRQKGNSPMARPSIAGKNHRDMMMPQNDCIWWFLIPH